MKFSILLVVQAALATLGAALPTETDPRKSTDTSPRADGNYLTKTYPNGTVVTTTLDGGSNSIATRSTPVRAILTPARKITKRATYCWYEQLSHWGTDVAIQEFRNMALRDGNVYVHAGRYTSSFAVIRDGVIVQYNVDATFYDGYLSYDDIQHAVTQMDQGCPSYTSSYYGWDGSPEGFGKWPA